MHGYSQTRKLLQMTEPGTAWRAELKAVKLALTQMQDNDAIKDQLEDFVYELALRGMGNQSISAMLQIDKTDFDMHFCSIAAGARAELEARVRQHTIEYFAENNSPISKIFLAKAFGNVVEAKQESAAVQSTEDSGAEFVVSIIRKQEQE